MSNKEAGIVIEALGKLDAEYHQLPFGPDHPLTFAAFLYLKLDAANRRNAHLEGDKAALKMALESNTQECNHWAAQYAQEHEAKEAAERKLADVREQVQFVKDWFLKMEDGLPSFSKRTRMLRDYETGSLVGSALAVTERSRTCSDTWVRSIRISKNCPVEPRRSLRQPHDALR